MRLKKFGELNEASGVISEPGDDEPKNLHEEEDINDFDEDLEEDEDFDDDDDKVEIDQDA